MPDFFQDFTKQYNATYKIRLNTLRSLINTSEPIDICNRIHDINIQSGKCLIKGILFISSDLKTTIFDRLNTNEKKLEFKRSTYISNDVKYFVEDETGRIEIVISKNNDNFLCTGMILGFVGIMKSNKFEVENFIFPDKNIKENKNIKNEKNNKVAFLSGLEISKNNNNLTSFKVITDFLLMQEIKELFLIGNLFLDDFEIFKKCIESSNINITIIPEYSDFGCLSYPLLPVHKNLFKKSIISYSNPCIFDFHNKTLSVTSHEIIKDLLKYLNQDIKNLQTEADGYRMHLNEKAIDETHAHLQEFNKNNILKVVRGILDCRLLCPNGPDTLVISPYNKEEVFLIDKFIDFFIIPNCEEFIFEKDEVSGCRVISIPNFKKTNKVLVVDLEDEDYEFIEFTN
ncbi:DNA polymerase delta small subunit (DPOD2) [Vairimorpha necatrix]|uniref:DNA polymerase delta small subunit (DPOD2) n=1 Tax=Vairimorpha necatrix TaxID=6039 RepID=A0AAX4JA85_9MICR